MTQLKFRHNRIVVITPTRERPENFSRMVESCQTLSASGVTVYAGIDEDDPRLEDYIDLKHDRTTVGLYFQPRKSLSEWTNVLAHYAIEDFGTENLYLVSMGDDHIVKSNFWDVKMTSMLRLLPGPGFAYGDDMMNGSGLCTCWMVSAQVVEALGWMMLPQCKHMFVDNAIMELGEATNRIRYIPNLTIEHLHPTIKKSEIDGTYMDAETNYVPDLEQFRNWRHGPMFELDKKIIEGLKWPT